MFKMAICDDEKEICRYIHTILDKHSRADEFMITEFYSGESLCNALRSGDYFDLIILDIEFPGISGVEVGSFLRDTLKDALTQILYVSSTEGYERKLFEFRPLNFLPKPVTMRKLWACVDVVIELVESDFPCMQFVNNRVTRRIPHRNIRYLESRDKRVFIYGIRDKNSYIGKLKDLTLPENFIQIHKSYIVNYTYVKTILYDCVVLNDGQQLPISRTYRKEVQKFVLDQER